MALGSNYIEQYLPGVRDNGGLATGEPTNLAGSSNIVNNPTITGTLSGGAQPIVTLGAGTAASFQRLTAAQSGSVVLFNSSAGTFVYLPSPSVGLNYEFVIGTAPVNSTIAIFTSATASVFINGAIPIVSSNSSPAIFVGDGTTQYSVRLNGLTTGGTNGSFVRMICTSATVWTVFDTLSLGSGALATPFGTVQ